MVKRSNGQQSKHDQKVKQEADKLRRDGWNIEADIKGYPQPGLIAGRRPDIVAKKAGATRIIEVETQKTVNAHKDQQATFNRHAGQKKRTTSQIIVTE